MLKFPVTRSELEVLGSKSQSPSGKRKSLENDSSAPKRTKKNAFVDRLEKFSRTGSALKQKLNEDGSILEKFTVEQRKDLSEVFYGNCADKKCLFKHLEKNWLFRDMITDQFNSKHGTKFTSDDSTIFYYNVLLMGRQEFKKQDLTKLDFTKIDSLNDEEFFNMNKIRLYLDYEKSNVLNEVMNDQWVKKISRADIAGYNVKKEDTLKSALASWYWENSHTDEEFYLINHSLKYITAEWNRKFTINTPFSEYVSRLEEQCPSVCNPKQIYNPLVIKKPTNKPPSSFKFSLDACEKAIQEATFLMEYNLRQKGLKKKISSLTDKDIQLKKAIKVFKSATSGE
ncbi:hypothetical protein BN7_847 [Wickerhamomyces ciferrii]|uniref:Uncharacterized protein n=1 Tax=Wickerhamomyces ciferrii (strain ATCC 14091 / BCRC 22168 / CBS 111 / JCM 3599 / NBRC 0793 / NRRL Y-1031 F-60-10) TaxID=1206466 RepID=K0KIT0_WICCF|nr:uncharacterized protein BN7_847 [Wickerhamomyces ciferrii]CCH41309.1 hypothetical protein BN7_847 [Wickerhamomyces ciferrii]